MKVYTKVVIDVDSGKTLEERSYDYDGPVAEAKGGMLGGNSGLGSLLGLFNTQNDPNQANKQFGMGTSELGRMNTAAGDYTNWLSANAPGVMAQFTPGTEQENNLFNLESSRYLNKLTPELSGSGILTSGPGMNAVSQGLQQFTTQFQDQRMQEQLKALLGIGALEQAPMDIYGKALSSLFGSGTGQTGGGLLGSGSGGGGLSGIGNLLSGISSMG